MTIQWFPGHMAKALRQVEERLKFVDIVLELRDCRIPYSSSNPKVDSIIQKKPRLIILNKADMADPRKTQEWITYYKSQNSEAIAIDAVTNYNMHQITSKSNEILKDVFLKEKQKGLKERPIKAMIIGIPNVGKSTLINSLAKRKATQTGDKPGVTKNQQWINVKDELMLLDTPGVLWPKFEDQRVGLNLAVTGAIKDNILNIDEVALYAVDFLKRNYPDTFKERYKLPNLPEDNIELLDMIGKNRGCLISGGRINYDKVYEIILYEIRNDKLGRLTFELPQEVFEQA